MSRREGGYIFSVINDKEFAFIAQCEAAAEQKGSPNSVLERKKEGKKRH